MAGRLRELGLEDLGSYRRRLEEDPEELRRLDAMCFVTISRFYRVRVVFDALRARLLPRLAEAATARGAPVLRAWSAGCASGEEPYTLAIVWELELAERFPSIRFEVLATDFDETVLGRAVRGCYEPTSLAEMPEALRRSAFETVDDLACVRARFRDLVRFECRDVRTFVPSEKQDFVLCRNVAFTYFDEAVQRDFLSRVVERLVPGGLLVIGGHERLPAGADADFGLEACPESVHVFVRA